MGNVLHPKKRMCNTTEGFAVRQACSEQAEWAGLVMYLPL
jgi:hypothetical protein